MQRVWAEGLQVLRHVLVDAPDEMDPELLELSHAVFDECTTQQALGEEEMLCALRMLGMRPPHDLRLSTLIEHLIDRTAAAAETSSNAEEQAAQTRQPPVLTRTRWLELISWIQSSVAVGWLED
eukprot:4465639-Prymnesium_polylepis.1